MIKDTGTVPAQARPEDTALAGVALPADSARRIVPSATLLKGESCITIEHGSALYTLRATRAGKLTLTK